MTRAELSGQLELHFFGHVEIRRGNKLIKLGPKRSALLAYLALEGRTRRKTLAQLLWSASDDPFNNLAVSLAGLKRVLGNEALEIDDQTVKLQNVSCDLRDWSEGFAKRDHAVWNLRRGVLLDGLEVRDWAVGFGEEFEDWLYTNRERLESEWRTLAASIAVHHLSSTQFTQALPYLEIASRNPEGPREDVSRWLILTFGALGQAEDAIQTFSELVRLQREELRIEPTARTRAALAAARTNALECQDLIVQELTKATSSNVGSEPPSLPLVGRHEELARLEQMLSPGLHGEYRAVILTGEPGLGKSRLAYALVERLNTNRAHPVVFSGGATPSGLPLAAFDTAIRHLMRERKTTLQTLPAAWRDALARLMPQELEAVGTPATPELEQLGIFEAILVLLTDKNRAVVILMDDLQWADQITLEFLKHLIAKPPRGGLVLVVTLRELEAHSTELSVFLEVAQHQNQGRIYHLEPLESNAINELALALGRTDINPQELRAAFGGNPFYVLELLRAAPDTRGQRVNDLIRARLELQPEVAHQVLETLAVLGNGASPGLVQRVSGRSLEEIAGAFEQLGRNGLTSADQHHVQFEHDLIREAVQTSISPVRFGMLHLRAARTQRQVLTTAATHYWIARDFWDEDDEAVALKAFLEAGATFALRGDFEGGLEWFERALEKAVKGEDRVRVLTKRSKTLERHGRYAEALENLETAEILAFESEVGLAAAVLNAKADLLINAFSDVQHGMEIAQRSLDLLHNAVGGDTQAERARALSALGWCHFIERDFTRAEACYREAIRIERALSHQHDLAENLTTLGSVLLHIDLPDALKVLEEAIVLAESINNQSVLSAAHDKLGIAYRRSGMLEEAVQHAQSAIEIRSVYGLEFVPGVWFNNLGNMYFDRGDYKAAHETYRRGLEAKDLRENPFHQVTLLSNVVEVGLRLANFDEVRDALAQAHVWLDLQSLPALEADLCWFEGELAVLEGDLSHASKCYVRGASLAKQGHAPHREASAYIRLARLERKPKWAEQALAIEDSSTSRAAECFVLGSFDLARAELKDLKDAYEWLRFDLDCGLALGDASLQVQARARLPL